MLLFTVLALGIPSLLYGLYSYLRSLRRLHSKMPSLPRKFLLGNMIAMGTYIQPGKHPDYGMRRMWDDIGQPDIFFVDTQPILGLFVIANPYIADQLTRPSTNHPYSVPKSYTLDDIVPLTGENSILKAEGEKWKEIRKQFQPGFQPKHLQTLIPQILDEVEIFLSRLEKKAETKEIFKLGQLTSDFTFDVIASVTVGRTFHAQTLAEGEGMRSPDGLLTAFVGVQENINYRGDVSLRGINPARMLRLRRYEKILGSEMQKIIKAAIEESITNPTAASTRSIVHLALKDRPLNAETLSQAGDQLRTFFFAGYDTTSTTIQWSLYYLSLPRNRSILDALVAEHDALLGPISDPTSIHRALESATDLPYTTAIVKEVLRLQPPAATARWIPPPPAFSPEIITVPDTGMQHTLNGFPIYINHAIIHTSPKVWGADALEFRPERWLDKEYVANLAPGAWRPFERGPRACIGQELAMLEAKIALAMTVRRFAFERPPAAELDLVGKPENNIWSGEGEIWNEYKITSVPVDGMRMRVRMR